MEKQATTETFFDYLDAVAMALYDQDKTLYLEGVKYALEFLLDDEINKEVFESTSTKMKQAKRSILKLSFDPETIRKAIQLALLRGFKHAKITNAQMTPDTIGIFISYLIKKLYPENPPKQVLDPLVGTGNLIATLSNHYKSSFMVHGIDDDPLMCDLARNMCDSLDIEQQIYLQNTLTFQAGAYDLIVTDFPPKKVGDKLEYLPYLTIIHHLDHLKEGHFFIAVIENDFFDQKQNNVFKKLLKEKAHMFGLIKLDESLFKNHPKSILILKKKGEDDNILDNFLLVDLPPFSDQTAFNQALGKMETWFKKKEVDVQ
ncbi:MAG: class I SAM-dependent methyltransferase [Bacillota bacterium]